MIQICKLQRMYADMHTNIIQIELPSCMRGTLIAFQKHDGHTYIHTTAYPWPTVRDPMSVLMHSAIMCATLSHSASTLLLSSDHGDE